MPFDSRSSEVPVRFAEPAVTLPEHPMGILETSPQVAEEIVRRLWSEAALSKEIVFSLNHASRIEHPPAETRERLLESFESWLEIFTADGLKEALEGAGTSTERQAIRDRYEEEVQYAFGTRLSEEEEAVPMSRVPFEEQIEAAVRSFRALMVRHPKWLSFVDAAVAGSGASWKAFLASQEGKSALVEMNWISGFANVPFIPVGRALLQRGLVVKGGACQRLVVTESSKNTVVDAHGNAVEGPKHASGAHGSMQDIELTSNTLAFEHGKKDREQHESALSSVREKLSVLRAEIQTLKQLLAKDGDVPRAGEASRDLQEVSRRFIQIEGRIPQVRMHHVAAEGTEGEQDPSHQRVVDNIASLEKEKAVLAERMHQLKALANAVARLEVAGYPLPADWSLTETISMLELAAAKLTTKPFAPPASADADYAE